jgi:hypothetical protein
VVEEQGGCPNDVLAGTWDDPYTGAVLEFDDLKEPDQAQAVTIDHVVPLAEAHRSGAAGWPADRRTAFAKDLDGLVAADGATNSDKSDSDPSRWRPPDESAWCAYALVWVEVKDEWSLAVDAREAEACGTCSPAAEDGSATEHTPSIRIVRETSRARISAARSTPHSRPP